MTISDDGWDTRSSEPRSSSQRSWSVLHQVRQKNSEWCNVRAVVRLWTERKKDRVAMTAEQTSWTEALVGPIGFSVGHVPELNPKRPDAMMTSRKHRTAEAPERNFYFPPRKRRKH